LSQNQKPVTSEKTNKASLKSYNQIPKVSISIKNPNLGIDLSGIIGLVVNKPGDKGQSGINEMDEEHTIVKDTRKSPIKEYEQDVQDSSKTPRKESEQDEFKTPRGDSGKDKNKVLCKTPSGEGQEHGKEQSSYMKYDLNISEEHTNKILELIENVKNVLNLTLKDHLDSDVNVLQAKKDGVENDSLNFLSKESGVVSNPEKFLLDKKLKMNIISQEIEIVHTKTFKFEESMSNMLKVLNLKSCMESDEELQEKTMANIKEIHNFSDKRMSIYQTYFGDCTQNFQTIQSCIYDSVDNEIRKSIILLKGRSSLNQSTCNYEPSLINEDTNVILPNSQIGNVKKNVEVNIPFKVVNVEYDTKLQFDSVQDHDESIDKLNSCFPREDTIIEFGTRRTDLEFNGRKNKYRSKSVVLHIHKTPIFNERKKSR